MKRVVVLSFVASAFASPDVLSTLPVDALGQPLALPDDERLQQNLAANLADHNNQAEEACAQFHCGAPTAAGLKSKDFDSYPMAQVPSIDFPANFPVGSDVIHVSNEPIFSAAECDELIQLAELEGEGLPSTKSGKYQIGKAWIKDMPGVLAWFNKALSSQVSFAPTVELSMHSEQHFFVALEQQTHD